MKVVFATNNANKIREIRNILGSSLDLLSLSDLNIAEDIPENEPALEGNAISKARHVHEITHMNVFADDTGLEVESLNGQPGVHSARFAGENKDSDANNRKLLSLLAGSENRNARFRTVIALIYEGKEYLFEGIVTGKIISETKGTGGFGYDPVFVPDGESRTFAEMQLDEKNLISHRARAFEKLRSFLSGFNDRDNKDFF
jgi:XTP/dITP diphosphohydrolase